MLVYVLAEDYLLAVADGRVEVDSELARAFRAARHLHAELPLRERLEVGRVTPELILFEGLRVMQAHDERCVDVVEEAVEAVADEHGRMTDECGTLAAVVAREDEQRAFVRVLAQAQPALDQRLMHREQHETLLVPVEASRRRLILKLA